MTSACQPGSLPAGEWLPDSGRAQVALGGWASAARVQRRLRDELEAALPGRVTASLLRSALCAWAAVSKASAEQRAAAERKASLMARCAPYLHTPWIPSDMTYQLP